MDTSQQKLWIGCFGLPGLANSVQESDKLDVVADPAAVAPGAAQVPVFAHASALNDRIKALALRLCVVGELPPDSPYRKPNTVTIPETATGAEAFAAIGANPAQFLRPDLFTQPVMGYVTAVPSPSTASTAAPDSAPIWPARDAAMVYEPQFASDVDPAPQRSAGQSLPSASPVAGDSHAADVWSDPQPQQNPTWQHRDQPPVPAAQHQPPAWAQPQQSAPAAQQSAPAWQPSAQAQQSAPVVQPSAPAWATQQPQQAMSDWAQSQPQPAPAWAQSQPQPTVTISAAQTVAANQPQYQPSASVQQPQYQPSAVTSPTAPAEDWNLIAADRTTAHVRRRQLSNVILVLGGRGGVGKTTTAMGLAATVAARDIDGARPKVLLVDSSTGQSGQRIMASISQNKVVPTIHDAQRTHDMRDAVSTPEIIVAARDDHYQPITFDIVFAPSVDPHDKIASQVQQSVYLALVTKLAYDYDVIVVDTPPLNQADADSSMSSFILPAMQRGAWAVVISDVSREGMQRTEERVAQIQLDGIRREQFMSFINKRPSENFEFDDNQVGSRFNAFSTFLGFVEFDPRVIQESNNGSLMVAIPTLAWMYDRILERTLGLAPVYGPPESGKTGVLGRLLGRR